MSKESQFKKKLNNLKYYDTYQIFERLKEYEVDVMNVQNQVEYFNNMHNGCLNPLVLERVFDYIICKNYIGGHLKINNEKVEKEFEAFLNYEANRFSNITITTHKGDPYKIIGIYINKIFESHFITLRKDFFVIRLINIFTFENGKYKLKNLFEKRFGISFKKMYNVIFNLIIIFNDTEMIKKLDYDKLIKDNYSCFKHLIITFEDYAKKQTDLFSSKNYDDLLLPSWINTKPVLYIKGKYDIPLPISFFKATFHNILKSFSLGDFECREALGFALENHVYSITQILKRKGYIVFDEINYGTKKSSDVLIIKENNICFVEVKLKEPSFDHYLSAENASSDCLDKINDTINQILRNINDYKNKKITKLNDYLQKECFGLIVFFKSPFITKDEIITYYVTKNNCSEEVKQIIMDRIFILDLYDYENAIYSDVDIFENMKKTTNKFAIDFNILSESKKVSQEYKEYRANKIELFFNELD